MVDLSVLGCRPVEGLGVENVTYLGTLNNNTGLGEGTHSFKWDFHFN